MSEQATSGLATSLHSPGCASLGLDLNLIPAGMTGNTKYFTRLSAWLEERTASTANPGTTDLRGAVNPGKSVTQPPAQPQEGRP